jgi:hypothetical protein
MRLFEISRQCPDLEIGKTQGYLNEAISKRPLQIEEGS